MPQPVGTPLPNWTPPPLPSRTPLDGRYCRLEPLDAAAHAAALFAAISHDTTGEGFTYLAYGPFADEAAYRAWAESAQHSTDPLFFTIIDKERGAATGVCSYLRITPAAGSIEVGHIHYSPLLQRTRAATEAMHLMMGNAFRLGYRRYEWKCDSLNAPSRRAAQRLGFSYEGIFRQATVVRGRNRDTSWYATIDKEWPALDAAFRQWLDPDNFDAQGRQRVALGSLTAPVLVARG